MEPKLTLAVYLIYQMPNLFDIFPLFKKSKKPTGLEYVIEAEEIPFFFFFPHSCRNWIFENLTGCFICCVKPRGLTVESFYRFIVSWSTQLSFALGFLLSVLIYF